MLSRLLSPLAVSLLVVVVACDLAPVEDGAELAGGRVHTVAFEGSGGVAAYVIEVGDGSYALVDTGAEEGAAPIVAALEARDATADDVTDIFLTHGHGDHIAGVSAFANARVHAMAEEVELIAGREAPVRPLPSGEPEATGIEVDEPFDGEGVVDLADDLLVEAFLIPGHTPGSAAYLAAGVLFLGDAANVSLAGELTNTIWIFSTDTEQNLLSLGELRAALAGRGEEIDAVACSHTAHSDGGLELIEDLTGT
jgi:glyoxylase-like metal-dependent hydrolase (beta-lactamase superfamily II)